MNIATPILIALASIGLALSPSASANAADQTKTAMTDTAQDSTLSGVWTKKSFKSAGTWEIYTDGDKSFVRLSADFRTRNAPDLKIFLSPLAASETTGKNATDGAVLVAPLSSNAGEQIYEIPAGVDLADFKSILIHCEQYSKLWSAADLT